MQANILDFCPSPNGARASAVHASLDDPAGINDDQKALKALTSNISSPPSLCFTPSPPSHEGHFQRPFSKPDSSSVLGFNLVKVGPGCATASTCMPKEMPQAPELEGLRSTTAGYVPRHRCSVAPGEEGKEQLKTVMRPELVENCSGLSACHADASCLPSPPPCSNDNIPSLSNKRKNCHADSMQFGNDGAQPSKMAKQSHAFDFDSSGTAPTCTTQRHDLGFQSAGQKQLPLVFSATGIQCQSQLSCDAIDPRCSPVHESQAAQFQSRLFKPSVISSHMLPVLRRASQTMSSPCGLNLQQ